MSLSFLLLILLGVVFVIALVLVESLVFVLTLIMCDVNFESRKQHVTRCVEVMCPITDSRWHRFVDRIYYYTIKYGGFKGYFLLEFCMAVVYLPPALMWEFALARFPVKKPRQRFAFE